MKLADLPDDPLPTTDGAKQEVGYKRKFLALLDDMVTDDFYAFARTTIEGIRSTVRASDQVTEGQKDAIHNIRVGAQRAEDSRQRWERSSWGRRYEGR